MNIHTFQLIEGAKKAIGLTVIIDVFRAFSLECYLFDQGAAKIFPVGKVETAFALREKDSELILIGERNEKIIPGFDYGNSPMQILGKDFTGRKLAHTTSAGTQGIVNAVNATQIITGSFVNAHAIARYINQEQPSDVSLVCMGYSANVETEEDTLCAEYISDLLENREPDFEKMKSVIRTTSGKRFFMKEKQYHAPKEDFDLCLQPGKFNFVLQASKENDDVFAIKKIDC